MKPAGLIALILVLLMPLGAFFLSNELENVPDDVATSPTPTAVSSTNTNAMVDPADVVTASKVVLSTSKGDITLELFPTETPQTVKNFVTLGKRGAYNGVIFHRVIQDFMIQGGDPTGTGSGGSSIYGAKFADEFGNVGTRKIGQGTLAMANAGANTNGSQFFIVTETTQPHLDGKHTNFGKVADDASMAVVKAIAAVKVDGSDRPVEPVTITGFKIVQ
jgi:peptidyl-prolyl cis-trans isomerase-like 1